MSRLPDEPLRVTLAEMRELMRDDRIECQWFALCDRTAKILAPHPVLTLVPTCETCAERFELGGEHV